MIGGVAGGLGRYFDVDPLLFRIGFVVLTFAGGFGLLAYLIGLVAIPDRRRVQAAAAGVSPAPWASACSPARPWRP